MAFKTLIRGGIALGAVAFAAGCSQLELSSAGDAAATSLAAKLPDPGPAPVGKLSAAAAPTGYTLDLTIDPRRERFAGETEIAVELAEPAAHLWLHGRGLDVSTVRVTDAGGESFTARYEQKLDSGVALVSFGRMLPAGSATVEIAYEAPFNTSQNALFRMERDGRAYAATQFQPIAARDVFPGFDEPRFKVPFDIRVTAAEDDVVITTTPEIGRRPAGDGMVRRTFATTEPLPTYLLAFAVGPYDLNDYGDIPPNAVRTRPLRLRAVAGAGLGEQLDYALANTGGILEVLETYFGSEYPYEKLDLITPPESFGGAMENVGAIVYDEYLLLLDEDAPIQQKRAYTFVHAHELAHMWFGDLVTPAWWDDLWLNESFASWMENKAADAYWPGGAFGLTTLRSALNAMNEDSLANARQIREPIERNEDIESAFDGITYEKGGGVLAMLENYAGEDAFRGGVQLHMERFAHGVATADDFMASLAEGSGRPELEPAFRSFIEQPGVPLIEASLACETGAPPTVSLRQSRYAPLGSEIDPLSGQWIAPICVSYDGARVCTVMEEREATLPLETGACPRRIHPNGGGAGYYRFALDEAGWDALFEDFGTLPGAEAITVVDSLDAAFRAGAVPASVWVDGMTTMAGHPVPDVTAEISNRYEAMISELLEGEALANAQRVGRNTFAPQYEAFSRYDETDALLLAQNLQRLLIVALDDQSLRGPLADQAAAFVGMDGDPDPTAISPDEWQTVLSVGVQDLGAPFFERLAAMVEASDQPAFRFAGAGALARTEDPELAAKLLDDVEAGRFQVGEGRFIVTRQIYRNATKAATYAWARANPDLALSLIPETFRATNFPTLGGGFCSAAEAADWEAFITSQADKIPGYERALAQTLETINLCAALKAESGEALAQAFAARAAGSSAPG